MEKIKAAFVRFWNGFKRGMFRFMQGRRGVDELAIASLVLGLVFALFGTGFRSLLLYLLGYACEIYAIFRMFSKNVGKRAEENRKFLAHVKQRKGKIKAFFLRIKLRKQYKYFRCPECRTLMRVNRGRGEVEITCPKCKKTFKKKA